MESIHITNSFTLLTARGPLAALSALDIMWVSFYSIGLLMVSMLVVITTRKWIKNSLFSFVMHLFAFGLFLVGSVLMVLTIATWPA